MGESDALEATGASGGAGEGCGGGDPRAREVLSFWLDEVGPEGWYDVDPSRDEAARTRFAPMWEEAADGGLTAWLADAHGTLAYVVLTDQLPRNMWRDTGRAFATDRAAVAATKSALKRDWDLRIDEPARQFLYLPLMHAECLSDQGRCVRLIHTRMPETGASNLLHAKAHREVIRRFGRFPHRNDALGRPGTEAEAAFLAEGGYGGVVRALQAA